MTGRYEDFEEFRPTGEATRTPDTDHQELRDAVPPAHGSGRCTAGYPDDLGTGRNECSSCQAAIPAGQTKCEFCLTHHLDGTDATPATKDTDPSLIHVVHLVVEATSRYAALAKGAAGARLLAASSDEPAVDDCQLIDDLESPPARQLTDPWPSLPPVVSLSSADGKRLLDATRDRQTWSAESPSDLTAAGSETVPFLYDETGTGIRASFRLTAVLETAGDDGWLVPAIALQTTTPACERPRSRRRSRLQLDCRSCDRVTDHRFREFESIPAPDCPDQPLWQCLDCRTTRYGPTPPS